MEQKKYNDNKWNFMTLNDFNIDDICESQDLMNKIKAIDQSQDLEYLSQHFVTWGSPNLGNWNQLTDSQKKFIISKQSVLQSLAPAFFLNQKYEEIKTTKYFLTSRNDGMSVTNSFVPRLLQNQFWNSPDFGSPFSCVKDASGNRRGYKFTDVSQFDGFQYRNSNYSYCHDPTNSQDQRLCQCGQNNQKRLYPIELRCRPWYLSSNSTSYMSFSDPYQDFDTNSILSTSTFKVVKSDQNNDLSTQLTREEKLPADVVLGIDFDLEDLQKRFKNQESSTTEYSYIVAPKQPNFDESSSFYEYTTITHPKKLSEKMKIYDIEFQGSKNKDEEIKEYLNKTSFMANENIRSDGCLNPLNSITKNKYEYLTINGQQFLTLFSTIQICYGNLYQQKRLTVGYLARSISETVERQSIYQISNTLTNMTNLFIYLVVGSFALSFFVLYYFLKQLLIHNFDIPISILNRFLENADSRDIYDLNYKIQRGEFKTQYELQNIITAINSVVISVQMQVEKEMQSDEKIENLEKIIKKYIDAAKVYYIVDHKMGYSLCLNNLAFIYQLKKNYGQALSYQQKANIVSDEILDEHLNKMDNELSSPQKQLMLCSDTEYSIFMKLHACRKFQLAQLIIRILSLQLDGEVNEEFISYHQDILKQDIDELKQERKKSVSPIRKNTRAQKKQQSIKLENSESRRSNGVEHLYFFIDKNQQIGIKLNTGSTKATLQQVSAKIISCRESVEESNLQIKFNPLSTTQINQPITSYQNSNENFFSQKTRKFFFSKKFYEKQSQFEFGQDKLKFELIFSNQKTYCAQALDLLYESLQIFQELNQPNVHYQKKYDYEAMSIIILLTICKCQLFMKKRQVIIEEILDLVYEKYQQIKIFDFLDHQKNTIHPHIILSKYYLIRSQLEFSQKNYRKSLKYNLKCLNFDDFNYFTKLNANQGQFQKNYYDPYDSLEVLQNIQQLIKKENIPFPQQSEANLKKDIESIKESIINQSEIGFFEVFFKDEKWLEGKSPKNI